MNKTVHNYDDDDTTKTEEENSSFHPLASPLSTLKMLAQFSLDEFDQFHPFR